MIRKADMLREQEVSSFVAWTQQILKVAITTNWLGNFLAVITIVAFTVVSLLGSTAGGSVTTARIFAVIATIELISEPLLMLGQQVGQLVTAWASFNRIEQFLLLGEKDITDAQDDNEFNAEATDIKMVSSSTFTPCRSY